MNVVNDVVHDLNPGRKQLIAIVKPLFALAKLIQRKIPETDREVKYVVMHGTETILVYI